MFPGPMQLVLVVLIVLLLFGGSKVPDLMRNLGRGASEFKKGLADEEGAEERNPDDARS